MRWEVIIVQSNGQTVIQYWHLHLRIGNIHILKKILLKKIFISYFYCRSATLFQLKEYKACIRDVDRAIGWESVEYEFKNISNIFKSF